MAAVLAAVERRHARQAVTSRQRWMALKLGSPRSVEVHRADEMVVDRSLQLVADTAARTVEVRVRPGTAQDVPGEGVSRGTEYEVRLNICRERPRAIGAREGLEVVEVAVGVALARRAEDLVAGRPAGAQARARRRERPTLR